MTKEGWLTDVVNTLSACNIADSIDWRYIHLPVKQHEISSTELISWNWWEVIYRCVQIKNPKCFVFSCSINFNCEKDIQLCCSHPVLMHMVTIHTIIYSKKTCLLNSKYCNLAQTFYCMPCLRILESSILILYITLSFCHSL